MSGEFVDTNVLVYAHDASSSDKHGPARELFTRLWDTGEGVISIQVLQEFFWTMTRKIPRPLSIPVAIDILEDLSTWRIHVTKADDVIHAAKFGPKILPMEARSKASRFEIRSLNAPRACAPAGTESTTRTPRGRRAARR